MRPQRRVLLDYNREEPPRSPSIISRPYFQTDSIPDAIIRQKRATNNSIAAALYLHRQRYAAAAAEPCCELHTCRGGAKITTSHWMMFFCRTFGALVPSERQGCQHQGGQRDGAHGYRAPGTARPRVARPDKILKITDFARSLKY